MSPTHNHLSQKWLQTRYRVTHDLLRRQLLPWCVRMRNALSGIVDDPALDANPMGEIAYAFTEAADGADWLVEQVDCMLPSAHLRVDIVHGSSELTSEYLAFVDQEWRSRLAIPDAITKIAVANREPRLRYRYLKEAQKPPKLGLHSLRDSAVHLESVQKLAGALEVLDAA